MQVDLNIYNQLSRCRPNFCRILNIKTPKTKLGLTSLCTWVTLLQMVIFASKGFSSRDTLLYRKASLSVWSDGTRQLNWHQIHYAKNVIAVHQMLTGLSYGERVIKDCSILKDENTHLLMLIFKGGCSDPQPHLSIFFKHNGTMYQKFYI